MRARRAVLTEASLAHERIGSHRATAAWRRQLGAGTWYAGATALALLFMGPFFWALSSSLKLTIWRDGKAHAMEFCDGDAVAPLAVTGEAGGRRGTEVTFLPSPKTFTMLEFDFATLEHRLRELAFLNSGVNIVLADQRHAVEKREEMRYDGEIGRASCRERV